MLNLVFIFVAFGWFVLVDNCRKKKYVPVFIKKFFKIYNKKKNFLKNKSEKNKSLTKISGKTEEVDEILDLKSKASTSLENDIETEISTLNFIAFILLFLSMLFSYIYIILSI